MRIKSNKVFVSVYKSDKSLETNKANHDKAKEMLTLEGIGFQVVQGVYKGNAEATFILSANNAKGHESNMTVAHNLGLLFNQESVLEVHNDDVSVLHYIGNGKSENIGTFTEVNSDIALSKDSYTYEPISNRYFIVS